MRVEDPYWCCGPSPWETNTRAHTHDFTHGEAHCRQWEAVAILFPAPSHDKGSRKAFKDETAFIAQGAPALLLPRRRNLTCSSCEMQSSSHTRRLPSAGSLLSFSVGKQQLGLWLLLDTPLARRSRKGHGKTEWSWTFHLFTAQLVHNGFVGQTHNGVSTLLHEQNPLCGCGVMW